MNRDGSDNVQFTFHSYSSPGGWNEGWIYMIMLSPEMMVNTISVIDSFCLDSAAYDIWFTYTYYNCSSENFYDTKDFTYAPVYNRNALAEMPFTGNTADTVNVNYYNFAHPPFSFPGGFDFTIHDGVVLDGTEQYFLFQDGTGKRFGLGIRAASYYTIFTMTGEI